MAVHKFNDLYENGELVKKAVSLKQLCQIIGVYPYEIRKARDNGEEIEGYTIKISDSYFRQCNPVNPISCRIMQLMKDNKWTFEELANNFGYLEKYNFMDLLESETISEKNKKKWLSKLEYYKSYSFTNNDK